MIKGLMLASYSSFGGGAIGNLFAQWEASGIFAYALPFLLIFALIFGILSRINIFKDSEGKPNNVINAIIALVVGLMSLQFGTVSMFFAEIFPRAGIVLSIILLILILGGLFIPKDNKGFNWFLIATVFIMIAVVVFQSFNFLGWSSGMWFRTNLGQIVPYVIFIGIIIAIIAAAAPKPTKVENKTILSELLGQATSK
jgi:hypothetical protein